MKHYTAAELNQLEQAITFDDVSLVPRISPVSSRSQVSLKTKLFDYNLDLPIISANMDSITGLKMALVMGSMGAAGVLHRFESPGNILNYIKTLKAANILAIPSIGISSNDLELAQQYVDSGADAICVDVAHGHGYAVLKLIEKLVKHTKNIIAGNVATGAGAVDLARAGARVIKVGVSGGSVCKTRTVTGFGVPQLSAVLEVKETLKDHGLYNSTQVISDGGHRVSGDCVKALAAGANTVMLGGMLAGCEECPLPTVIRDSKQYKEYRGMASESAQIGWKGKVSNNAAEGESTLVPHKGYAREIIEQIAGGIRSGVSYAGVTNLSDLSYYAKFILNSHAGYVEGLPHLLIK